MMNKKVLVGVGVGMGVLLVGLVIAVIATGGFTNPF